MKYNLAALNPNSKKLFWVYIKSEKLDELLNRWSTNKLMFSPIYFSLTLLIIA